MSTNSIILANYFGLFSMPQFDFTTLFSVTASALVCWAVYYSFFSINLLQEVLTLTKFRSKLLNQGERASLSEVSLPGVFLYKGLVNF